ncbi:hypothetical protein EVAR_91734_1 [Eumeta japonica]|uniref:DUF5641 domain-containing protein n=1 Tax=Eumeta variegata TaxID=151549 RepID=A0A4C1SIY8_EUMVA|nr:hypothetical protein EVAR_91734_1 [Eumeta japonica]
MGGAWGVGAICQNRVGRYIERGALAKSSPHPTAGSRGIVNSRPLTEVDIEPAEAGASPNHFLIGRSCGAAAAADLTTTCSPGLQTGARQRLADHFWQRWLSTTDSGAPPSARDPICRAPAEGVIVLIVDSSSPRYSWPRGRIKKTYPGPDSQVRVVDVETTGGVLRRPTSRSSCWCQLRRRLFRVLKCSAAPRENVTDSRAIM